MRCIICLHEGLADAMSEEHVFPEAIGGAFSIRTVCKPCNDRLGHSVDAALTEHSFIQLERLRLGIEGKSNRARTSLDSGTLCDDPDQKVIWKRRMGAGGRLYAVQNCRLYDSVPGAFSAKITVDASDEDKLPEIVNTLLTRRGMLPMSREQVLAQTIRPPPEQPWVSLEVRVDLVHFQRGLLKIAYELACAWLGESYVDDPIAQIFRSCMLDISLKPGWSEKYPIRGKLDFFNAQNRYPWWQDEPPSHIAFSIHVGEQIGVYVRVFHIFGLIVKVTDQAAKYPAACPRFLAINPVSGTRRHTTLDEEVTRLEDQASG